MGGWLVDGVFNIFQEHRSQFFLPTGKYKYRRMVSESRNKVTIIWITSTCGRPKKRKSTLMRILFPSYGTIYIGQELVFLRNLIISRYVSLGAKLWKMTKIIAMSGCINIEFKGIITITHLRRKCSRYPNSVGLRKTQRERKIT